MIAVGRQIVGLVLALWVVVWASAAQAQEPAKTESPHPTESATPDPVRPPAAPTDWRTPDAPVKDAAQKLLENLDDDDVRADCLGAEIFGGTLTERRAYCLLSEDDKRVTMRRLAQKAVREDPGSYRANFLMGYAQHVGETNLPKALYFLEEAERLLIERFGRYPARGKFEGLEAYRLTLLELVYVHGEMDHHEEKIEYVDELFHRLGFDYRPLKSWPLLKLKRFDEAKAIAESSLAAHQGDPRWEAISLTALCAVYSEMRLRQESYDACRAAAEPALVNGLGGGVSLSNAAAAAMEMFKFDEAERLYNEATRRDVEPTINPWGRLAHLFLRQGRFAEAVSALKKMQGYRMARPAHFDQQDQADAELTTAAVLMIAGRMEDALRITSRVVNRPDRQGTSSAAFEQNEAGNLLMDRVARLDVARRLEEEASWSPWKKALRLRFRAAELRVQAWLAERRAAALLSDPERLMTSLRPECPGSVELPVWLDGEVVQVVHPGVALAAIERGRTMESLPDDLAEPVFRAFEAEAFMEQGDWDAALDAASDAVANMSPVEVLHRSRAAAIGAHAARKLGDLGKARALYQQVIAFDPGIIRRFGHTLPVVVKLSEDTPATRLAADYVADSPRFDEEDWGFGIEISEHWVRLTLPDGSELQRAPVSSGKAETPEDIARRIARAVHEELLVPKVDITQADVRSLDGGLTGGGRASERAKSILDEVLEPEEPSDPVEEPPPP